MNKNLRKKALIPALAMALASIIALSGVTYAWFTTGNSATVGTLDVNVQTANGIQISLDASTWKSNITSTDIINAVNNSQNVNIQFPQSSDGIVPVSTAGYVENGKMKMFKGELKNGALTSTEEIESTSLEGNFIAFDLYFKASGADQVLTLKYGATQSYVKCINLADSGKDSTIGTEKAVRVAFLPMGVAQNAAGARALKDVEGGRASLIWEPNMNERASGVEAESGRLGYDGLKSAFSSTALEEITSKGYAEAMPETFDGEKDIVTLKSGINKIRVYIWLEGQDVDCVNDISFADFATNLYFSVPEVQE